MSTLKRKRQTISIEIKKQIIDAKAADSSKSYADLARDFSNGGLTLDKGNIQAILNKKDEILAAIDKGIGAKRAHLKPAKYEDLETAILIWFKQVRSENVAVSGLLKYQVRKLTKRPWKAMKRYPKSLNKSRSKQPRRVKHYINSADIAAKIT